MKTFLPPIPVAKCYFVAVRGVKGLTSALQFTTFGIVMAVITFTVSAQSAFAQGDPVPDLSSEIFGQVADLNQRANFAALRDRTQASGGLMSSGELDGLTDNPFSTSKSEDNDFLTRVGKQKLSIRTITGSHLARVEESIKGTTPTNLLDAAMASALGAKLGSVEFTEPALAAVAVAALNTGVGLAEASRKAEESSANAAGNFSNAIFDLAKKYCILNTAEAISGEYSKGLEEATKACNAPTTVPGGKLSLNHFPEWNATAKHLSLVDKIFEPLREGLSDPDKLKLDRTIIGFRDLIGDIHFTDSTAIAKPAEWRIDIKQVKPLYGPIAFRRKFVRENYEEISDLLFAYCNYQDPANFTSAAPFTRVKISTQTFFDFEFSAKARAARISVPGLVLDENAIESMYGMYEYEMAGVGRREVGTVEFCKRLNPSDSSIKIDSLFDIEGNPLAPTSPGQIAIRLIVERRVQFIQRLAIILADIKLAQMIWRSTAFIEKSVERVEPMWRAQAYYLVASTMPNMKEQRIDQFVSKKIQAGHMLFAAMEESTGGSSAKNRAK